MTTQWDLLAAIVDRHEQILSDPRPAADDTDGRRRWAEGIARDLCRTPGAHETGREVRVFPCPACLRRAAGLP